MLILFDGPEGGGKSTLAKRLSAHMKALYLREPGGDPISERIRKVLLSKKNKGMEPLAEFFLFQASRAQFVSRQLRPALESAQAVVLDRYSLSTMAYQIAGRGLPPSKCIQAMNLATGGLVPDVTFLLMCTYETGKKRQKKMGKKADRLESEARSFHERVIAGYRRYAGQLKKSWSIYTIETDDLTEDEVFQRVLGVFRAEHGIVQ